MEVSKAAENIGLLRVSEHSNKKKKVKERKYIRKEVENVTFFAKPFTSLTSIVDISLRREFVRNRFPLKGRPETFLLVAAVDNTFQAAEYSKAEHQFSDNADVREMSVDLYIVRRKTILVLVISHGMGNYLQQATATCLRLEPSLVFSWRSTLVVYEAISWDNSHFDHYLQY